MPICGHDISIEEPDRFNRIVGDFLARSNSGRCATRALERLHPWHAYYKQRQGNVRGLLTRPESDQLAPPSALNC